MSNRQFMPVVSPIIPKLYENSCDCLLIRYFKSLNTTLCKSSKYATPQMGELNSIAFVSP